MCGFLAGEKVQCEIRAVNEAGVSPPATSLPVKLPCLGKYRVNQQSLKIFITRNKKLHHCIVTVTLTVFVRLLCIIHSLHDCCYVLLHSAI